MKGTEFKDFILKLKRGDVIVVTCTEKQKCIMYLGGGKVIYYSKKEGLKEKTINKYYKEKYEINVYRLISGLKKSEIVKTAIKKLNEKDKFFEISITIIDLWFKITLRFKSKGEKTAQYIAYLFEKTGANVSDFKSYYQFTPAEFSKSYYFQEKFV